jgi:16S rRNA (cytosine967-C5)-methyltransferase
MLDAREIAYNITRRVNAEGGYLSLILQYGMDRSGLDSRDRALVAELVYGVQRHRNRLDYIIKSFSRRPLDEIEPEVLDLLRLGVYQISEMRVPAHASVNEAVSLADKRLHRGAASFVNAVLRAAAVGLESLRWPSRDDFPSYLETVYSHPRWMVENILGCMDKGEAEALCAADNDFRGLTLRMNPSRADREMLMAEIAKCGGRARASPYLAEALVKVNLPREQLLGFLEKGYCVVQDESSMVVGYVVHPVPGSTIVDACAAPGGKATHLAQLGGDTCRVIAVDKNPGRLEALRKAVGRLGVRNVDIRAGDAARLLEYVAGPVDAILLDAPCSGLGTLRRNPELKWRRLPEDIAPLAELQLALLDGCAGVVRPGGVLVYSVCTFTREETVEVMEGFLNLHRGFRLEDPSPYLPPALRESVEPGGYIQLMPHSHSMEGMFIARLVRA